MMPTSRPARSSAVRAAFGGAAVAFAAMVARVPSGGWDQPGLGEWSVRSLAGHASRSLLTVEAYLAKGADSITIETPLTYFQAALTPAADNSITERGRQAGLALGDDPAGTVRALADRVTTLVQASADDAPVGTPWGGITLLAYLPTRIFELTVHTLDLSVALGLEESVVLPDEAVAITFDLIGRLARQQGRDAVLLLAATGRRPLPPGYTVL